MLLLKRKMTETTEFLFDRIPLSGSRLTSEVSIIPGAEFAQDGDGFFYSKTAEIAPAPQMHTTTARRGRYNAGDFAQDDYEQDDFEQDDYEQDEGYVSDTPSLSNYLQTMIESDDEDSDENMDQDVHAVDVYEHRDGSSILEQGRVRKGRGRGGRRVAPKRRTALNEDGGSSSAVVSYDEFFQQVAPRLFDTYPNLTQQGAHDLAERLFPEFLKRAQ